MSKVIFLDIDGTIASHGEYISPRVKKAIQDVRKDGHLVILCTGRNKIGTRFMSDVKVDGMICSAGAYIEFNNEVVDSICLEFSEVSSLINIFNKSGVLMNMEATEATYADDEIMRVYLSGFFDIEDLETLLIEQKRLMNVMSIQSYFENPAPIHKVSFIAYNQESLQQVYQQLNDHYTFIVQDLYTTNTINGELIPKNIDKGKAIRFLIQYLGLDMHDTIAFGDSMNDYEMLETCAYAVAMGNSDSKILEIADKVCEDVKDEGVYHELKRLKAIGIL